MQRTTLRALAKKGLTVAVPCPSACTITGALLAGGKKVGGGRAWGSGGPVSLKLELDRKAKRKRLRKVTVRVTVNAGGATQTASQTAKLKR